MRARLLVIGASTGGPKALRDVLAAFGQRPLLPILIVQHMPATYTHQLALDLTRTTGVPVREAVHGEPLPVGEALLAPGGYHMRLKLVGARVQIVLDQGPLINFVRPALDCLLESIVPIYGGRVAVAVLTGMGADGLEGCRSLAALGAHVVAQSKDTAAVWGMPGAVVNAGIATAQLTPQKIGQWLVRKDRPKPRPRPVSERPMALDSR